MAQDITEQATQDELADSLVSEPEETQPQQDTDTGTEELQETVEETETQSEEDAEDYLPEETSKIFPDEELTRYAERRYPELVKALNNPNIPEPTREQLRQALHDKLNTDIYLRQLQEQSEREEEIEEEPEPEAQPEPTQPAPQLSFDQHIERMTQAVKQNTSPEMAKWIYNGFMQAFGVPKEEADKLAPAQAQAFTEVLSVGALNLINTFAPQLFEAFMPQVMEQQFPQFGEMYQTSAAARSWDSVRNTLQSDTLPAYGTKEYSTAARKIGADIAGSAEDFEAMVFTRNGKPLSAQENVAHKQRIIAQRMMRGDQPPPALVAQAVKTGEKAAERKLRQQQAGNLGAGKSKANVQGGDDDFWAEGMELYQKQHGSM